MERNANHIIPSYCHLPVSQLEKSSWLVLLPWELQATDLIFKNYIQITNFFFLIFSGIAALNQYIYMVGGYDGQRQLNTVERYDTENNTWGMVACIRIARSALSVTVLDGKLYAMGMYSTFIYLLFQLWNLIPHSPDM